MNISVQKEERSLMKLKFEVFCTLFLYEKQQNQLKIRIGYLIEICKNIINVKSTCPFTYLHNKRRYLKINTCTILQLNTIKYETLLCLNCPIFFNLFKNIPIFKSFRIRQIWVLPIQVKKY